MREIKFRVWDNKRNFMDYEPQITIDMGYINNIGVVDCNGDFRPYKDEIIMQYIGLKDKNDKEIYEGDIVNITPYGDKSSVYKMEIKYSEEYADYSISYKLEECWFEIKDLEVIGNIYENPELLGDKK